MAKRAARVPNLDAVARELEKVQKDLDAFAKHVGPEGRDLIKIKQAQLKALRAHIKATCPQSWDIWPTLRRK